MLAALAVLAAGRRLTGLVRVAAIVLLASGSLAMAYGALPRPVGGPSANLKGIWKPFDKEALAKYVGDGKVVFVDVTAEWCITCQVNKAAVVYRGKVAEQLMGGNVIAMQADWTRPDDSIAAYLASFGRYGIPFNAVYGPGAPDGITLPELLTEDAVLDAVEKAKKPS
jgi:suppressor for copper-sensitivity B